MTPTTGHRAPALWRFIGRRIRIARKKSGINPTAFALTIRVSKQAIHQFEHGDRGVRLEVLYRIARATGRPISYFLPSVEEMHPEFPESPET